MSLGPVPDARCKRASAPCIFVAQGLFDGPRPVLLESCSVQDLAMLLSGSRRQASRIEFGAHQVTTAALLNVSIMLKP